MTNPIVTVPRTFVVEGASFTDEQVIYLKSLFKEMDMAILPKEEIRKNKTIQNAMASGIIVIMLIDPASSKATLNLSQLGRELLGKV